MSDSIAHPIQILFGEGAALACSLDAEVRADELHGLFAADTRVLSTYRMTVGGQRWQLLGRRRSDHGTASWCYQNPLIRDSGVDIPAGSLFLDLRRRVARALHDDIRIWSFARQPIRVRLVVQIDADFADVFEVKQQSLVPRVGISREIRADGVALSYERPGFQRGLLVGLRPSSPAPTYVGALLMFELKLAHDEHWTCCVEAEPVVDGHKLGFVGDPHGKEPTAAWCPSPGAQVEAESMLKTPYQRGCADLRALAVTDDGGPPYIAAGTPWFLALFGRDTLVTALMSGLAGSWPVEGALAALGARQARRRDDWRDAEPGKLPHELRRGELAHRGLIPHTPYYGSHDAPALYCLALWHAWRWTGDRGLLDAHLDTARAALRWCDELGDRDGDGLQEYATRSPDGLTNQGWKDSGEAVVRPDGELAQVPLATVELQGYLYAARLAMAELLEASGRGGEAGDLRRAAAELRSLVEERFWLGEQGFYAFALDGDKHPVASIASNPGHLLWTGLPAPDRALLVTRRLLEPDLFTGWGLRTLSADHPCYNPLSYQVGSVWPHDTILAAGGMWRYGLRAEGAELLAGVLGAAAQFEDDRLPELFAGFDRRFGPPVPYQEANVPHAWAAAAPVMATQLFLGLVPDAPNSRCLVSPWLPEWLPKLAVRDIPVGEGTVQVVLARRNGQTVIEALESRSVEVIEGQVEAPLWGRPAPMA